MRREASPRVTSAPATLAAYLAPFLLAVSIAVVAFAWLGQLNPPTPLSDDGIRDQLLARDCTDLGRCHLIGPPSSVAGIYHGSVWLDLLIAVRLLGGDVAAERNVVIALVAVSIATVFIVVWRWLRPAIALPGAVLFAAAVSLDNSPSWLISPSISVFGDVLTAAGLLCYGLSGQRRFLIASAFALGVALNLHVGSLTLIAPLLTIAVLARPRPWGALLIAVAVFLTTCVLAASAALRANIIGLAAHRILVPAVATGFLLVPLVARLGPRFRRVGWAVRAWLIGLILLLPFAAAALWLVAWQAHPFAPMYLHPIVAPAAVMLAVTLCFPFELAARWLRALRWIPSVAVLSASALAMSQVSKPAPIDLSPALHGWTLVQSQAIAAAAARRGWSYEDLVYHIQGSGCRELLAGMSIAAPPPKAAARGDGRQLQVVKVAGDACAGSPDADDCVQLDSRTAAIVRDVDSWLRPESSRACRVPVDARGAAQCSSPTPLAVDARAPERFLFISRSFPEIHSLDLPPPYTATYEIPIAPRAGETRDLIIADAGTDDGWRITRADGMRVEDALPARRVRLHADSDKAGLVVMEKLFLPGTSSAGDIDMRYPPCVFEAAPDDPLEALVGGQ